MQTETKKQIANLTSNILNPFLGGMVILLLLSFASVASTLEALKWAFISIAVSILPVFWVVIHLVRNGRIEDLFTIVREQRTKIYLLSGLCASAGAIILTYLGAPSILVVAFVTGLSMAIIFMGINLWWKISLHTACIAASATVLIMLYGWVAAITVALVPLTAWSRIKLEHHSLAQATIGALLASIIVVVALYPFLLA